MSVLLMGVRRLRMTVRKRDAWVPFLCVEVDFCRVLGFGRVYDVYAYCCGADPID